MQNVSSSVEQINQPTIRPTLRLSALGVAFVLGSLLGVALSTQSPARAQSQAQPPKVPMMGGGGPLPLSPEQREQDEKVDRLAEAGAKALDAGDYTTAEKDARQKYQLDLDPYLLAQVLYAEGKDAEALPLFRYLTSHGNTEYNPLYATLLLKSGQWEQAVEVYNNAMDLIITNWKSGGAIPSRLGLLQPMYERYPNFDAKDYRPQLLETVLHLAVGLYYNRHLDLAGIPYYKQALAEYQKALALNPHSDIVNYYVGHGWQQLGENAKAQAAYQKAIAIGRGSVKDAATEALKVVNAKIAQQQTVDQKTLDQKVAAKTGN